MFNNLILSGGEMKGICFIGAIRYLEETNNMKNIKTLVGASSGSLICFLICLGLNSFEMQLKTKNVLDIYKKKPINIDSILNINNTLGFDNGLIVTNWVKKCLFDTFGKENVDFLEFTKITGKNLVICASNLTKREVTFFSVDNTPNVLISDAIRASISIPLIFTPVHINNQMFVDAVVFNNFPVEFLKNNILKDTLGISIKNKDYTPKQPLNILSYIYLIIDNIIEKINLKTDKTKNIIHIVIDYSDEESFVFDFKSMKLSYDSEQIDNYIQRGYDSIKKDLDAF